MANLALGTAQWGMHYGVTNSTGRLNRQTIVEILKFAAQIGVVILDTARSYGDSEEVIGENLPREHDWKIYTKLDAALTISDLDRQSQREAAEESLRQSRSALGKERLDAVMLHRPALYGSEAWKVLVEQREDDRIGMIGYSALTTADADAALEFDDVEVVQVASSLLDQRLLRSDWFERANNKGVHIVLRSVYLQGAGLMQAKGLPDFLLPLREVLTKIDEWAFNHNVDRITAFLAAVRSYPVDVVLVGCESLEQLTSTVDSWREAASSHLQSNITQLHELVPILPVEIIDPSKWPNTARK